jgi:hypothetical protein
MTDRFEVEWEGRRYFLSPQGFYDAQTFLKPPEAIHQHLKARPQRHTWQPVLNVRRLHEPRQTISDFSFPIE